MEIYLQTQYEVRAEPGDGTSKLFGEDGLNFRDILDVINPLQHIPFVNNLYRKYTGDTISPAAQVAGAALYGGAIGAAVTATYVAIREMMSDDTPSTTVEPTAIAAAAADFEKQSPPPTRNTAPVLPGGWMVNAAYAGRLAQMNSTLNSTPKAAAISQTDRPIETYRTLDNLSDNGGQSKHKYTFATRA